MDASSMVMIGIERQMRAATRQFTAAPTTYIMDMPIDRKICVTVHNAPRTDASLKVKVKSIKTILNFYSLHPRRIIRKYKHTVLYVPLWCRIKRLNRNSIVLYGTTASDT